MPDGKITFSTALDNKELEKQLSSLTKKVSTLEDKIGQKQGERLPMTAQVEQLGVQLDVAKAKLYEMQNAATGAFSSEQIKDQKTNVSGLQSEWNGVQSKVEKYDADISKATIELDRNKEKAGAVAQQISKTSGNSGRMGDAINTAGKNLDMFKKRLASVVRSALVFVVITQALAKLREWIGSIIKVNPQAKAAIAKLEGALLTLAQPLVNLVIPAFISLVDVLTEVLQALSAVTSMLANTTVAASAAAAKALNKQTTALDGTGKSADAAGKSMASFDQINSLGSPSTTITPDFSGMSGLDTKEYKDKINKLTTYVSGALLALGVILTFSGANIPLGLGLMALGAVGLAAEVKANWDEMPSSVRAAINITLGVLSTAGLVIGAILTFSGANLPLGIALMAVGAASLATVVALNWNTITTVLQGTIGAITTIVSASLLVIGAVLAFSGVSILLGLGLMAAGAAGLTATAAANWDTIVTALQGPVGKITALISGSLLVIGAILIFTGVAIPLGLGLMIAGAAGLAATVAVNWDAIVTALQGPIGKIVAIVSGALLVLGIILVCTGVGIPLGIGLIVAGAAGLAAEAAINWDTVKDKVKTVFADILSVVSGSLLVIGVLLCLTGAGIPLGLALIAAGLAGSYAAWTLDSNPITNFVKSMANSIIDIINSVIEAINNLFHISFDGLTIGGKVIIPAFDSHLVNIPTIPGLATGAVIPPNQSFLAMLGDQKSGTNIEAPESLIRRIVREESGSGGDNVINLTTKLDGKTIYRNQQRVSRLAGKSLVGAGG